MKITILFSGYTFENTNIFTEELKNLIGARKS